MSHRGTNNASVMSLPRPDDRRVPFWALLVGINEYKTQNRLLGCVADVENMRDFLVNRYHVPSDQIRVLTNGEATRQAILDEFQSFLTNNPRIQHGDQILFHYSGHGSQMPSQMIDLEPDGLDETIVPYDSRTAVVYDIPDKVLGALLYELAEKKGSNITVILDSCHSGSGTRGLQDPNTPVAPGVRLVAPDDRNPPPDLDARILGRVGLRKSSRASAASGWLTADMPYILLAGCRDWEVSREYRGSTSSREKGWHGALTYFLLKVLNDVPADISYRRLHEKVAQRVTDVYPNQHPQCEGEPAKLDSSIFGGVPMRIDPFVTVQEVSHDNKTIVLNAGRILGLFPGTKLALYPTDVTTRDELVNMQPLASARVTEAGAMTAEATIDGDLSHDVLELARAIVMERSYESIAKTVALDSPETPEGVAALHQLGQLVQGDLQQPGSAYLELVDDPLQPADMRVRVVGDSIAIYDNAGLQLTQARRLDSVDKKGRSAVLVVLHYLESIARWQTLAELKNDDLDSELRDKIRVRIRRYVREGGVNKAQDLPPGALSPDGRYTFTYDPQIEQRIPLVIDIFNEARVPVYPYVFIMGADYSIKRAYPKLAQQTAVKPTDNGEPYPVGLHLQAERVKLFLPDDWNISEDTLKVIVSTKPAELSMLEQDEILVPTRSGAKGSRLQQVLDALASGESVTVTRLAEVGGSWADEDWTTVEIGLTTVRAAKPRAIARDESIVVVNADLTVEKPVGLHGTIAISSWSQALYEGEGTRSATEAIAPPPGFRRHPELFQPLTGSTSPSRNGGLNELLITLEVDEASRKLVTRESPLRLKLNNLQNSEGDDLVAVAFDGEDYLIVGYRGEDNNVIEVVSLPQAKNQRVTRVTAGEAEAAHKGLGRAIKLFLYKKMGRYIPNLGLHRANTVNGKVEYSPVESKILKLGERIALFVHGFGVDSRWMVTGLGSYLQQAGIHYDHMLTWDYESLATGIRDTASALAQALTGQGSLGASDELTVDLYSHGMGSLVSRYLIESAGGDQYIDRLVMAGSPNNGTTLATMGRGLIYLSNVLLNRASFLPPLGWLNGLLKNVYDEGLGTADLAVGSPFVHALNALTGPAKVPYLVLAGQNLVDEEDGGRLARIAHKVLDAGLDAIFGEQNDAVVGLSSMTTVRNGTYARALVKQLACDHFHYFEDASALEAIRTWVSSPPPGA